MRRGTWDVAAVLTVAAGLAGCTSSRPPAPQPSVPSVRPATSDALPSVNYARPEGPMLGAPVAAGGVMESFSLDFGALTVIAPPPSLRPVEPMSRALTAAREADPAAFSATNLRPVVGYGLVTIAPRYWRRPAYRNTPAWVVAYQDNRPTSCPAAGPRTSPAPKASPSLPNHRYTVFVLPDAETWAVTFVERARAACFGTVLPSSAELATSNDFVVWRVVARKGRYLTVGYRVASCAQDGGSASGGNTKTNTQTIEIGVSVPFGHPPNCSGTRQKTMRFTLLTPTTTLTPPHAGPASF